MTLQPARLKPYLFLLVILLLAFLPVSTFHFAMKNDAFSDNFPNKYFFSEAIHSGFMPLWNPYLNFGFPIYADPGFAFWNPITWFFGAVTGYNAYTLTAEVLLYIYIAGITMFWLSRHFNFSFHIAIAVASMYMCSGFFTGELQHINFLTAAAFLPFLVQRFLVLSASPGYKNAVITSVAYYFVFTGGHPAIPIGTVYFFTFLTFGLLVFSNSIRRNWKMMLQFHLLSILVFILLYSPAIYSYASVIQDYGRDKSLNQLTETSYGFSPASYLSFLYPFATAKDALYFTDDLSMRNIYFSLAGFALVLCQLRNKNYLVRSFLLCALFMLILSSGGYIKAVVYSHLPFLNRIRTNGEFRIFSILCFCIISGFGLNEFEKNIGNNYRKFRKTLRALLIVTFSVFFFALVKSYSVSLFLFTPDFHSPITIIKTFIDKLTFYNALLLSSVIQSVIILLFLKVKFDTKKIAMIIVADLIINSIAYLPFTGVGTVTLSQIQNTYNKSEKGIKIPSLTPLKNIDTFSVTKTGLVGSASFYNKKIGITKLTDYPSYFSNTVAYLKSSFPRTINNLPYVFLKKNINHFTNDFSYSDKAITVSFFSPQQIDISVNSPENDSLIFLQNHYKYWKAKTDGQTISINKSFITFMSVPLNKGHHFVKFHYEDNWLNVFVIFSMCTFATVIIYLIRKKLTR